MTKQILIGCGVVVLVAFLLGSLLGSSVQANADAERFSATLTAIAAQRAEESVQMRLQSEATPTGQISPSLTPTPVFQWSCVAISANIPNAYRAILAAGNASIWENPPFKLIKLNGEEVIVYTRPELSLVHPGEYVCVYVQTP
jgi:hypothetical protein